MFSFVDNNISEPESNYLDAILGFFYILILLRVIYRRNLGEAGLTFFAVGILENTKMVMQGITTTANEVNAYRNSPSNHMTTIIVVHETSEVCNLKVQKPLFHKGSCSTLFNRQLATVSTRATDFISKKSLQEILFEQEENFSLLREKLSSIAEETVYLQRELASFLDPKIVEVATPVLPTLNFKDNHQTFVLTLKSINALPILWDNDAKHLPSILKQFKKDHHYDVNYPPMLVFNKHEAILIRSPQNKSKKAIDEYIKLKEIYRLHPIIRNLVLKNKSLQESIQRGQISETRVTRNSFQIIITQKGQPTLLHTFQQTYLGNWRYVGVAEKDSYREIFHRNWGRSPV